MDDGSGLLDLLPNLGGFGSSRSSRVSLLIMNTPMSVPAELGREGAATGCDTGTVPIDADRLVNQMGLDALNADGRTGGPDLDRRRGENWSGRSYSACGWHCDKDSWDKQAEGLSGHRRIGTEDFQDR